VYTPTRRVAPFLRRLRREGPQTLPSIARWIQVFNGVCCFLNIPAACLLLVSAASSQAQQIQSDKAVSRYSADSTLEVRPETALPPPPVNQVFRDPDFGSRMVRVTDASGIRGHLTGFSFITDSSAETNAWGKLDPKLGHHGGYYFYVTTSGGGSVFFVMDALTMQVKPICVSASDCRFPAQGNFSYTQPDVVYGQFEKSGVLLDAYHIAKDKQSRIYDFSQCPNIPRNFSGYEGSVSNSGDDTKFAVYLGGRAQGFTTLVAYYDRFTDRCYWYDTATGTVGGSKVANASVTGGTLPRPPLPMLKATKGNLPPGDYFVQLTASTRLNPGPGETLPSAEAQIKLDSPGGIEISPPMLENPQRFELLGYSVYIGTAPNKEMRQAALRPLNTPYVQALPLSTGLLPPTMSTAGYNVHNARLSRDGKVVRINSQQNGTIYFWTPGTNQISRCGTGAMGAKTLASFCGGHTALGYSHMINHDGPGSYTSLLLRPLSDLSHATELLPTSPGVHADMDTHWSWNNADPSDSTPVCGAFSAASFRTKGDGTQGPTNPLLAIRQPWDREIVCVATTGPPTVWRFAHHRATGACNSYALDGSCFGSIAIGNVSQDGKFYLFSSDWEWSLGGSGCPSIGKCRIDSFIVELK
jgi:hypothetical protein